MTTPIATLEAIQVRLGGTLILREATLTVEPAAAIALFGANGSGKTTLLRTLATLVAPSAGRGVVLGATLATPDVERVRPRIGLVGHEAALYPALTLHENLHFVARLAGLEPSRIDAALKSVGLDGASDRRADRCSTGMLRRAEFARLLMTEPDLLLLDEAHVGLDAASQDLVETTVKEVTKRGGAAILVSHDPDRVASYADRSMRLADGMLEETT